MKLLPLFGIFFLFACEQPENAAPSKGADSTATAHPPNYDSALAAEFGADDYGMKQYIMAFLKRGPNRDLDSARAAELQMQHLENINRMAQDGDLVLAGPFMDTGAVRGIYIFDVHTIEEARALTETDPAIKAGSLVMELRPWYGSAALMDVNKTHELIQKKGVTQ